MRALLGREFLVVGFFHFLTLKVSCHSLLTCRVSAKKSAENLMGMPSYITCCLSFVAFNTFSLYLIFAILISMGLDTFLVVLSCVGLSALPGLR